MTSLTPGFLPASAFAHSGPTAMGVLDLERPEEASLLRSGAGRDALVLVRLHGDPLGVVHVADERIVDNGDELVALVHQQLGEQLSARSPGAGAPEVPGTAAVIVATVGRLETLDRCLESLAQITRQHVEIIVVDNRPAVGTRALVAEIGRAHV